MNNSNFPQVFRMLLRILADISNAVVWMVFTHLPISISSSPLTRLWGTVPGASVTIGIMVIFMFHSFLVLLFSFKFSGPPGRQRPLYNTFSFLLSIITRSGFLTGIR